jgi:hypothetical protein
MSKFYKSSNNETSSELFNKKTLYNFKISQNQVSSLVSFFFAEKSLFGKVDLNFVPIIPRSDSLKGFKQLDNSSENIKAISFVTDAFEAMSQQFKKSLQTGQLNPNDPYLTNLKVYKGYKNYNAEYINYQEQLLLSLKKNMDVKNVLNFDDFVKELITTISNVTKIYPMSIPAYTKSTRNSFTNTGLCIEIADVGYDNDEQKISDFVNSKNWNFYVNTCNSYGFMIDTNTPWRLIADIDSIAMLGYAQRYGFSSSQDILTTAFRATHNSYFNQLPQRLLQMYNRIVPENIITEDRCGPVTVKTERYTLESLQENYSEEYFLKFYFNLRFTEEENYFSEAQKNRIIKDCLGIARTVDRRLAISKFELLINQPFDYRGSLSYINKVRKNQEGK